MFRHDIISLVGGLPVTVFSEGVALRTEASSMASDGGPKVFVNVVGIVLVSICLQFFVYPSDPILFALLAGLFLKVFGNSPLACSCSLPLLLEECKGGIRYLWFTRCLHLRCKYFPAGLNNSLGEAINRVIRSGGREGVGVLLGRGASEVNELGAGVGIPATLSLIGTPASVSQLISVNVASAILMTLNPNPSDVAKRL